MFQLCDFVAAICPKAYSSNLLDFKNSCTLGMKVDFGGVVVIDRPVSGNYDICFTVANSLVLPRPLVLYTEHTLHDKSCIKEEMQYSSFPMDVRMRGTQVTSYISEGIVHIAVPDLDESVFIAKSLAIYDLLVQKRSLNSAVATYIKSRLPVITMMSSSVPLLVSTHLTDTGPLPNLTQRS